MQFPAFPGPELINWEGVSLFVCIRNAHKQWNTILFFAIYYYNINQFAVCFLVDSKMNSNQKECTNPEDRWFTDRPNMSNNRRLHSASGLKLKALEV